MILISFKIVVVFNTTSADIKTKSADVVLKTTTILREMRIVQMSFNVKGLYDKHCFNNERTLYDKIYSHVILLCINEHAY